MAELDPTKKVLCQKEGKAMEKMLLYLLSEFCTVGYLWRFNMVQINRYSSKCLFQQSNFSMMDVTCGAYWQCLASL